MLAAATMAIVYMMWMMNANKINDGYNDWCKSSHLRTCYNTHFYDVHFIKGNFTDTDLADLYIEDI